MQYKLKDWKPGEVLYAKSVDVPMCFYDDLFAKINAINPDKEHTAVIQLNIEATIHITRPLMKTITYKYDVPIQHKDTELKTTPIEVQKEKGFTVIIQQKETTDEDRQEKTETSPASSPENGD